MTMMNRHRSRALLVPALAFAAAAASSPARAQDPAVAATVAAQTAEAYELRDVVEQPELLNRREVARLVRDNYPREMRRRRETGTVTLRFLIRADGTVDSARVTMLNATNTEFAEPAAAVARQMRFKPATVDGRPVAVWVMLPVLFMLETRTAPATRAPGDARPPRSRE
jgi:protein TonB